jgi:predicted transposase YdaD
MKKVLIALLLAISAISPATPINRLHIPADSQWLLHVDFDAFRDSEMGSLFEQEIKASYQKKIDGVTTLFGTDLMQDLHGFSLYGPDADEKNAAALIYAKYDKQKLLALLGMNEKYAESNYQEQTLYYWLDEKHNRDQVGAFATADLIVISQSKDTVTAMLDLLKEPSKSIANAQDNALTGLSEAPEGTIMITAADGLSELIENNHHTAILKNSKWMAVIIGENDGIMKLNIDLIAETTETTTNIEQVIRGMQAFMTLNQNQQPEITQLIQATTLQRNENQLALTFQYPSVKLFEMMMAHRQTKNQLSGKCQDEPEQK